MVLRFRVVTAAGALAGALALAGCGGSGSLLTSGQSQQLDQEVAQVSSALSSDNCQQAADALNEFDNDLSELAGVNSTLVSMLRQGASTASAFAAKSCPTGTDIATETTTTGTHTTTTVTQTQTTQSVPTPVVTTATQQTGNTGNSGTAGTTPVTTATQTQTTTPPVSGGAGLTGVPGTGGDGASANSGAGGGNAQ